MAGNFGNLPEDARPVSPDRRDIGEFANFFISYLYCSFDIVTRSPTRSVQLSGDASDAVCWCELCTRLTSAADLKLKKVTGRDKAIADSLEEEAVRDLGSLENVELSEKDLNELLKDQNFFEERALVAYGVELIRRCRREETDASSLILWRRFAWDKEGRPKKNFTLTADLISEANNKLIAGLRSLSGKH